MQKSLVNKELLLILTKYEIHMHFYPLKQTAYALEGPKNNTNQH